MKSKRVIDEKEKKIFNEKVSDREDKLISEYCRVRYESKVSQRDIANNIGIAQSTVARIERNVHSAQLSTFIKILSFLGYHLEIKKD